MLLAALTLLRRTLIVIVIVLAIHAFVGCSSAPRRAVLVPTVVPVLHKITAAKTEVSQARVLVGDVRLSLTKTLRPEQAAAGAAIEAMLDQLNARLVTAEAHLEGGTAEAEALQPRIEKVGEAANRNADVAAVATAKAKSAAHLRNWYIVIGLALAAWIFRRPLLALLRVIFRAVISIAAPYLAPLTAFLGK